MDVVYLNYWYDTDVGTPERLLDRYATVRAFPIALARAEVRVTVVQRYSRDVDIRTGGVDFRFVRDGCRPGLRWQIPWACHDAVRKIVVRSAEALVHVNGLIFPRQLAALRRYLPQRVGIVIQHHAESPWTGLRGHLQREGLRAADAFLFASAALASPWTQRQLIRQDQSIHEVMESPIAMPTHSRGPRLLPGDPVVLWVGRLDRNKDPIAVLDGFDAALRQVPTARLYMVYAGGDLLPNVVDRIAASDGLRRSVQLMGALTQEELGPLYASADFFVLGSHQEGSGYALAEAMAHGVVPVVTSIPSFVTMTSGAGWLWSPGVSVECAQALVSAMKDPITPQRDATLHAYRNKLSAEAIGCGAVAAYRDALSRRAAFA